MKKRCAWNAGLTWFRSRVPQRAAFLAGLVLSLGLAVPGALGQAPDTGAAGGSDQDVQVLTRGAGPRGVRLAGRARKPQPGPDHSQRAPRAGRGDAPRPETRRAERPVDPGLLELGPGRNDFVWVSGVWREPPPGRQWVPGYWNQVEGGFQWVPGDWVPVTADSGRWGRSRRRGSGRLLAGAAGEPGDRAEQPRTRGRRLLVAGKLVLARQPVRLATRVLGGRPAELGLDPAALRLDARGIPVR